MRISGIIRYHVRGLGLAWAVLVLAVAFHLQPIESEAAEGAASNYIPGAYGNFGVAIAPPAPGAYFQNDVFYFKGDAQRALLSGLVNATLETEVVVEMMTGLWVADTKVLGATYAAGVVLPLVHADLSGRVTTGPVTIARSADRFGLGDMGFVPASLFWTLSPEFHVNLYHLIVAPTGGYTTSRVLNVGRNYWSFDTILAMTYMAKTGTELSIVPGIMANTQNTATNYTTGTEFHMDWMVNQFFAPTFAVGVHGYVYRQITGDSGSGARLGSFKGQGNGIGGALMWVPVIGQTPVKFVVKVMHEFGVKRRFKGTWAQFQFGLKF